MQLVIVDFDRIRNAIQLAIIVQKKNSSNVDRSIRTL